MKERYQKLVFAWTSAGWLGLLVACTPTTIDESTGNMEPADTSSAATAPPGEQVDAQPTDIIDRFFSPLDNAVTDINRDLNKGDADSSAESNE